MKAAFTLIALAALAVANPMGPPAEAPSAAPSADAHGGWGAEPSPATTYTETHGGWGAEGAKPTGPPSIPSKPAKKACPARSKPAAAPSGGWGAEGAKPTGAQGGEGGHGGLPASVTYSSSAAPSNTAAPASCPASNGQSVLGGGSCDCDFTVNCDVKATPGSTSKFWQQNAGTLVPTLAECIEQCDNNSDCTAALW